MAISDQLTLLNNTKQAIKTSINKRGGSVTDSTPFADYSTAIDNLPSGGDNSTLIDLIERDITSINIPSGTTSIGESAFQNCSSLTSVIMPNSITEIKQSAFARCFALSSVTFSENLTIIGNYAFQNCNALTSLVIPNSVTTIQDSAFYYCTSLTSVTLGTGLTALQGNNGVFAYCTHLTKIICLATTPPTLGRNTFTETNNCPIYVPAESVDAYKASWISYASRIFAIPEDVKPAFKFTSSVDSSKDVTVNCEDTATAGTLTANDLGMSSQQIDEFRSAENTGSVEIGDCVKIYMAAACYTAKGISEVKLNEGLESIGDFAFGGMSALTEITIPSTVTNISYQAFYADRALTSITCLATTPPTLGSDVFGDTNNCPIYVPAESVDAYKTAWSQYADRIQAIPAE